MIPPRTEDAGDPFLLLLNGAQLVPLNLSWAILLANFMDQLEPWSGREIGQEDWQSMLSAAVKATRRTYPGTGRDVLLGDLEPYFGCGFRPFLEWQLSMLKVC